MNQKRGFTLIELTVAIIIIGVLGAMLVPRFIDIKADAHRAAVEGTATQLQVGANMAHSLCVVRSWYSQDNLPGFGNDNVDFNSYCYPSSTSGNNSDEPSGGSHCKQIFEGVMTSSLTVDIIPGGVDPDPDFRSYGIDQCSSLGIVYGHRHCRFLYRRGDETRYFDYDTRTGSVTCLVNP